MVPSLGSVSPDVDIGEADIAAGDATSAPSVVPDGPEVAGIGIDGTGGTSDTLRRSGTPLLVVGRMRKDGEWRILLKNARAEELLGVGGAVEDDGVGSGTGGGRLRCSEAPGLSCGSAAVGSEGTGEVMMAGKATRGDVLTV